MIPRWVSALLKNEPCVIHGDGETSRDFCHIDNVVEANLLAAAGDDSSTGQVYNIGSGSQTTLNELYAHIREAVSQKQRTNSRPPIYEAFRPGDIRHSLADLDRARKMLGYIPYRSVADGIGDAVDWYIANDSTPAPRKRIDFDSVLTPGLSIVTDGGPSR